MKINRKRGFTIVELIIVIAVIAILAAVLIPTFSNLLKRAYTAADQTLVKNLNNALRMDTEVSTHKTMSQALEATKKNGFDVSKINAKATENEIVWDSLNDCFAYIEADKTEVTYIPDSQPNGTAADYQLWTINNANGANVSVSDKYSTYLAGTVSVTVTTSKDIDVGKNTGVNVEYTNSTSNQNVDLNMKGGKLTVNDTTNSQQYFYGTVSEADITTGSTCFHNYGLIAEAKISAGKVIVEDNGSLFITSAAAEAVVEKNGGLVVVTDSNGVAKGAQIAESTVEEKASFAYEIDSTADMFAFRESVNGGLTFEGLTVKLAADISLNNENWLPIGNYRASEEFGQHKFMGTFDGQNHKISGLFIDGTEYPNEYKEYKDNEYKASVYGALFGYVEKATIKNVEVHGFATGTDVGGIVGALGASTTIENVTSYVNLTGKLGQNEEGKPRGKVAGLVVCTKGDNSVIKNCKNYGDIDSPNVDGNPVGGIVALVSHAISIANCENHGKIEVGKTSGVGGIVGINDNNNQYANCKNFGDVFGCGNVGGIAGSTNGSLTDCENSGNITTTDVANVGVGGIVGRVSTKENNTVNIIEKCKNSGNITAINDGVNGIGGIVGYAYPGEDNKRVVTLSVSNCQNTADIKSGDKSSGIIGSIWNVHDSQNSYSYGYKATITGCTTVNGGALIGSNVRNDTYTIA